MSKIKWTLVAGVCALTLAAMWAVPANAQEAVKAKAPMYSYISNWQIPRAHWAEMKADAAEKALMDKAMADGTLVGYGFDQNLVHTPDGWTHDDWFASMSEGGIYSVLKQLNTQGMSTTSVLEAATKHWDMVFVSRYYGWQPGATYKGGIVAVSKYKLKKNAPDGALNAISSRIVAPLMEKLLADGTIVEYEIDTLDVHTTAPGTFWIATVVKDPADVDKVDAAIRADIKAHPMEGVSFDAVVDMSAHRDEMALGDGVYK
ncbi:MAG TPA: hypothetical protein VFU55_06985 [Terracidiphilus sp.]|nr:hypothetical protein [Terracidiphilus sp.]